MSASHAAALETATYEREHTDLGSEESIQCLIHDLRQPLSTMEAIAYYLEMTLPAHMIEAHVHLQRLQRLVEESNSILAGAVRDSRKRQAGSDRLSSFNFV